MFEVQMEIAVRSKVVYALWEPTRASVDEYAIHGWKAEEDIALKLKRLGSCNHVIECGRNGKIGLICGLFSIITSRVASGEKIVSKSHTHDCTDIHSD
jgi:hypothetical protein